MEEKEKGQQDSKDEDDKMASLGSFTLGECNNTHEDIAPFPSTISPHAARLAEFLNSSVNFSLCFISCFFVMELSSHIVLILCYMFQDSSQLLF